MYTIGDSTNQPSDRDQYVNDPLRYGSSFTFFLRAYPLIVSINEYYMTIIILLVNK